MPDSLNVAAIGDGDLLLGLKVLGVKVFSSRTVDEARQALKEVERGKFALCFIAEDFFEALAEEREILIKKSTPVVAGFSDFRAVSGRLAARVREMAVRATGSDALVKRKG